jgi:Zn-dependent M16 (insulinase) family peptidase
MKGAMSDPESAFVHKLNENLFKDSQYRFNSGGEPKYITDLQYNELVEFHKMYYHPTNAHFFTYGDLDLNGHLKFVEEQVITHNFERNEHAHKSELTLEKRLQSAIHKEENFMPDLMSPADNQAKLGIAFLCDLLPAKDDYESFCLNILSSILLSGPNAPFYKAIIEEGIAPNFCPGAGYDSTTR